MTRISPLVMPSPSEIRKFGGGGSRVLSSSRMLALAAPRVGPLAAPAFTAGLGKGLKEPVSPYRTANVFGADLNTPNADNWNAAPQIMSPTTAFDLSSLTSPCEVVVALTVLTNLTQGGVVEHDWYRVTDGALLFSYQYTIANPPTGYYYPWVYVYSYIGYIPTEIYQNGGYRVDMWIDQGYWSLLTSLSFTVTGIPVQTQSPKISSLILARLKDLTSGASAP